MSQQSRVKVRVVSRMGSKGADALYFDSHVKRKNSNEQLHSTTPQRYGPSIARILHQIVKFMFLILHTAAGLLLFPCKVAKTGEN